MQVFLIEEAFKPKFWKKCCKVIEIKNDKIIFDFDISKIKFNKKAELSKKIREILDLNLSNKIILSKNLKKDKDFVNLLYSMDIDIIQEKDLFKILLKEIIQMICIKNELKEEETEIGIAINEENTIILNEIQELAKNFKIINIVTNHINRFKSLQKRIFEEQGLMININNNKRKGLINSTIVINVDFPEELMNKYFIKDDATIVNLEENIKIYRKKFIGKIINDYKISLKKGSKIEQELMSSYYKNYDLKDLLVIYLMNDPKEIENIIISD